MSQFHGQIETRPASETRRGRADGRVGTEGPHRTVDKQIRPVMWQFPRIVSKDSVEG